MIAADDDKHLELTNGVNKGKDKAMEAAKAVNHTAHITKILECFGSNCISLDILTICLLMIKFLSELAVPLLPKSVYNKLCLC